MVSKESTQVASRVLVDSFWWLCRHYIYFFVDFKYLVIKFLKKSETIRENNIQKNNSLPLRKGRNRHW